MAKTWTYQYNGSTIEVKNSMTLAELYVNGELQDNQKGLDFSGRLTGKLKSGEEIKASLGGNLSIECSLFINNELQTPISN